MSALQIVLLVAQLISCVVLTLAVMFQSSKEDGLSALTGGNSENYFSKSGATLDAKLQSATKWIAAAFVLLTLVNALLHHCGDSLSGIGGEKRPGIVHRIDRDTSGLIIAAKNDAAHLALSAQLSDHTLARTYECLVMGNLRQDSGTVDAPIGRHPTNRKKMAVNTRNGRRAVTHWEVIARYNGVTHVRCRLETGRTHQIRVHMAYIGHPILGDTVYGAKKPVPGLAGQCLQAVELRFVHPRTGELVTVSCPRSPEFEQQLRKYAGRS